MPNFQRIIQQLLKKFKVQKTFEFNKILGFEKATYLHINYQIFCGRKEPSIIGLVFLKYVKVLIDLLYSRVFLFTVFRKTSLVTSWG